MDLFTQARRPDDEPGRSRDGSGRAPGEPATAGPRVLSVRRLAERIRRTLQEGLPAEVRVRGEISNLSRRKHWFFSLKDADATIQCVAFAGDVRRFDAQLVDGDEVVATGRVDHWTAAGRTQLYVRLLERAGRGTLQQRYEALVSELRELGWFDEARKRRPPFLPRRIAVITSAAGAAIADVRKTVAHRMPAVGLVVYDVRVQGEAAAGEVAAAIRRAEADAPRLGTDAILVTRGGGSLEDLWAFNEREVAEAIHACGLPVAAAIGHESDTTIAELVADLRGSTPTQAAMLLVPDRSELAQQVDHLAGRLRFVVARRLERGRERIDAAATRPVLRDPRALLAIPRQRLDGVRRTLRHAAAARLGRERIRLGRLEGRWRDARPSARQAARREHAALLRARLDAAIRRRLDRAAAAVPTRRALDATAGRRLAAIRTRLDRHAAALSMLDPANVLARGYTYTTRADDGALVRGPGDAGPGSVIVTHAADGTLRSRVEAGGDGGAGATGASGAAAVTAASGAAPGAAAGAAAVTAATSTSGDAAARSSRGGRAPRGHRRGE